MAEEEKDIFYVNIENPTEIQRSVLECTKAVLANLKKYEAFRGIRAQKAELMIEYKNVMSEIKLLNARLKKVMPKTGLRAIADETPVEEKKPAQEPKKVAAKKIVKVEKPLPSPVRQPKSNLEKLESELDEIEKRLKSLGH